MTTHVLFSGIDHAELTACLERGIDPGGNPIEPFVDHDGGWTLRCCLTDSRPGDQIAIIAWSPFPWDGPYRELGPLVVHADGCDGFAPDVELPDQLDAREMCLRPYGRDQRIAYDHVTHVGRTESVADATRRLLQHDDITLVHGRNLTGGCFAFTASRAEEPPA